MVGWWSVNWSVISQTQRAAGCCASNSSIRSRVGSAIALRRSARAARRCVWSSEISGVGVQHAVSASPTASIESADGAADVAVRVSNVSMSRVYQNTSKNVNIVAQIVTIPLLSGVRTVGFGLARGHANRAIQPDCLAIEHRVLHDGLHQRGVLLRAAQARREWHLLAERLTRWLWQPGEHRRIEDARCDAHHADAVARQL